MEENTAIDTDDQEFNPVPIKIIQPDLSENTVLDNPINTETFPGLIPSN